MSLSKSVDQLLQLLDSVAGQGNTESACPLSSAVILLLEDGLKGNRAVPASPWSVIIAAARAYPLQLEQGVEKARAVCGGDTEDELCNIWALQAVADGSLATLLANIGAQPQLLTAYTRDAPLRNSASVQTLIDKLTAVKGAFQGPYDLMQVKQGQVQSTPAAAAAATTTPTTTAATSKSSSKAADSSTAPPPQRVQTEEDARRSSSHSSGRPAAAMAEALASAAGAAAAAALQHPLAAGRSLLQARQQQQQQQQQQDQPNASGDAAAGASKSGPARWLSGLTKSKPPAPPIEAAAPAAADLAAERQGNSQLVVVSIAVPQDADRPVTLQLQAAAGNASTSSTSTSSRGRAAPEDSTPVSRSNSSTLPAGSRLRGLLGAGSAAAAPLAASWKAAKAAAVAAVPGPGRLGPQTPSPVPGTAEQEEELGAETTSLGAAEVSATAAGGRSAVSENSSTSKSLGSWLKGRNKGPAPQQGTGSTAAAGLTQASGGPELSCWRDSSGKAADPQPAAPLAAAEAPIAVLLQVAKGVDGAGGEYVQLLLRYKINSGTTTTTTTTSSSSSQVDNSSTTSRKWQMPGRGLLNLRTGRSHSSSDQPEDSNPAAATPSSTTATASGAASRTESGGAKELLGGDHWSLLTTLKQQHAALKGTRGSNSSSTAVVIEIGGSESSKPSKSNKKQQAAEQLQQLLQESQQQVLQQVCAAADAVQASAWQGKGILDEECVAVLQLVAAVQQLLQHGLKGQPFAAAVGVCSTPDAEAAGSQQQQPPAGQSSQLAAADAAASDNSSFSSSSSSWGNSLQGWLGGKPVHPLQALQVLELGDKQHAPVQLGAGSVLNSTVVRTLPPHQQTEWWVRSSLNQQLLGCRIAVIAARGQQQLIKQYHPAAALLLPPEQLQPLVKAVKGCDVLRFDLTVPQPDAVAPGPASGARAAAAALAAASQGFNKLASKLPAVPRFPNFAPAGSKAPQAAAAVTGATVAAPGVVGAAVSSFAWPDDSSAAAAAAAAPGPSHRHVVAIHDAGEGATSSGLMSPASSGLLSPLANSEDAAADWWSLADGGVDPGGVRSRSVSVTSQQAATAAAAGGTAAGTAGAAAQSAAAQQLEQQLSQTLTAPMPALLIRTAHSTDGQVSSPKPGSGPAGSSRSSTPGWDAAVAAARARCQQRPLSAVPFSPVAASLMSRSNSSGGIAISRAGCTASMEGDAPANVAARTRHGPKRSCSANDLPDVAKLTGWDPLRP